MRSKSIFLTYRNNKFHFLFLNLQGIRVASELSFNSIISMEKIHKYFIINLQRNNFCILVVDFRQLIFALKSSDLPLPGQVNFTSLKTLFTDLVWTGEFREIFERDSNFVQKIIFVILSLPKILQISYIKEVLYLLTK